MKYKNIDNAIHNFGHSFMSSVNYVDEMHVVDEIKSVVKKESGGIWINFSTGEIKPMIANTRRINASVTGYRESLASHLLRHNVDPKALNDVTLHYQLTERGEQTIMLAVDDRGVEHKVLVKRS